MKEHHKASTGADADDQIRREAGLLAQARHPGVVELLRIGSEGGRPILVTARVSGRPLCDLGPLPPEEVAGLGAAIATTLADLHEMGVVHGTIAAEHVIVRDDGSPVLCGFGRGGHVGELVADRPTPLDPGIDVAGLGRIIRQLAVGSEARGLRRVAAMAVDSADNDRPTARALTSSLEAAVPNARMPMAMAMAQPTLIPVMERPRGTRYRRSRHSVAVASVFVTIAAAGVVVLGGLALFHRADRSSRAADSVVATPLGFPTTMLSENPRTTSTTRPPTVESLSRPTARTGSPSRSSGRSTVCPEVAAVLVADVDGDGCNDALTYHDGILATIDSRWELGSAGDVVVTGDWSCARRRTVALLRPATGEVFRFDDWATAGRDVSATPAGVVPGGRGLRTADVDGDGCNELMVERDDATVEVVKLVPEAPASVTGR